MTEAKLKECRDAIEKITGEYFESVSFLHLKLNLQLDEIIKAINECCDSLLKQADDIDQYACRTELEQVDLNTYKFVTCIDYAMPDDMKHHVLNIMTYLNLKNEALPDACIFKGESL